MVLVGCSSTPKSGAGSASGQSASGQASYYGNEFQSRKTASGERFSRGELKLDTRIVRAGKTLWLEQARLDGDSPLLQSAAGLAGAPVFGTLLCAGFDADDALLAACRALPCAPGEGGVTRLPGLLVARYRGACSQSARAWFVHLWSLVRPAMTGRAAQPPRIWAT